MSNKGEEHMDREETYDRPLPHNYEAERVLLGAMLVEPDAFDEATNVVDENDFFRVAHQHLFKTMVDVKGTGQGLSLKAMEARIVKEKSTLRELIYAAGRILSAAYVDLNEKEPDTH